MRSALTFVVVLAGLAFVAVACGGCDDNSASRTAEAESSAQQKLTSEALAETGMPAITNFRERKFVKDIYELRDQSGLTTYTYLYNEFNGKLVFLGETIGYGIPYAAQYSASLRRDQRTAAPEGALALPQSEPNGLYLPESAEGTWVMLKDPNGKDVKPVYVEPRIIVSQFRLPDALVQQQSEAEAPVGR